MIAFFFTMPISMMMPTNAYMLRSLPNSEQRDQRAETGGRQAGQDRQRMDEALVQDAEHEVDHEDREHEQDAHAAQRRLERLRGALERADERRRQAASRRSRP